MIRKLLRRLIAEDRGAQAELEALRANNAALRRELARVRAQRAAADPVPVGSLAEAARVLAQGRRVQAGAAPAAAPAPGRRAVVVVEDCIACGTCLEYAPAAFVLGDDGRASVLAGDTPPEAQVQAAMDACPTSCIRWSD